MNNILENAIYHLFFTVKRRTNPKLDEGEIFYANLLMNMRRHFDEKLPAVAAVNVTDQINLYINPTMYCQLSLEEQVGILKHECNHVMMNHFERFNFKDKIEAQNYNLAADAAINQLIPEIPEKLLMKDKEYYLVHINNLKKQFPNILEKETSEYYYTYFKKHAPKNMVCSDDHSKWEEGEKNQEAHKQVVKDTLKKAVESTKDMHGKIPDEVSYTIEKLSKSIVNWKNELHRFVANSIDIKKEETRKKRHKRFNIIYPGTKTEEILHIAFITDTSGSMSDKSLEQAWSEMVKIHSLGVKITFIEADCIVQNVSDFNPKNKPTFKGRGGTAYQPALDKAKELKTDAIVFLGDMDSADKPKNPKMPLLWVIVGKQNPPGNFGRKIFIGDI